MTKSFVIRNLCALILLLAVAAMPVAAQDRVLDVDDSPVVRSAPTGGSVLISQAPNQSNGIFSDSDCDFCGGGAQSLAENFTLAASTAVGEVMWWAGWFPGDNFTPDSFDFRFLMDAGGIPGGLTASDSGVPSATATGVILFGVSEYEMFFTFSSPPTLGAGTHFLEIFGNSVGNTDSIFWEVGDLDVGSGVAGQAFAFETPGSSWSYDGFTDLAYVLFESTAPVPTMGAMSFALLAAVLLGLSLAVMAHFKKRQV